MTVNVTPLAAGGATPTGTVSVTDGVYTLPTPVTLVNGSATITIPANSLTANPADMFTIGYAPATRLNLCTGKHLCHRGDNSSGHSRRSLLAERTSRYPSRGSRNQRHHSYAQRRLYRPCGPDLRGHRSGGSVLLLTPHRDVADFSFDSQHGHHTAVPYVTVRYARSGSSIITVNCCHPTGVSGTPIAILATTGTVTIITPGGFTERSLRRRPGRCTSRTRIAGTTAQQRR